MERRERGARGARRDVREWFTPLNAASAWAVLVAAGTLWPPLDPLSSRLAFLGEVLVFSLLLHVLHELGHVIAGAAVGLPFHAVTVGLLTVRCDPREDGWRFRWEINRSWRRFAGCVERVVTPAPGLREALTVTAIGGPFVSLVAGVLLLLLPSPWSGLGYVSMLIGLLNAIPTSMLGQPSDGMIVYRLWGRGRSAVAWRARWCDPDDGATDAAR